jgi:hypothetical protein
MFTQTGWAGNKVEGHLLFLRQKKAVRSKKMHHVASKHFA